MSPAQVQSKNNLNRMNDSAAPSTSSNDKKRFGIGGYVDKPWFLRFWDGMTAIGWFSMLARNGFQISPRRWGMAFLISLISSINLVLTLLQMLVWSRRIDETQLSDDPIFVIGHWRSGTTLLHELLVLDGRHTYSNTYDCFAPNHFLLSAKVVRPLVGGLLPKQRPMDNMATGWDCPQEDEFALCSMGLPSPYMTIAFPNRPPQNQEFYELRNVSTTERGRWQRGFLWFLKCVTLHKPGRIVLKSPPHTFRVKILLEMFPKAKFVHIIRNPYVVFPSTVNLWKRLYRNDGLQIPTYEGLEDYVFETFTRMYTAFERDRSRIPPGQFSEVRYEDLIAQPVEQMQRIYRELGLQDFEKVRGAMEHYFGEKSEYKTNRYELPQELKSEVNRRWATFFEQYGYTMESC